MARAPFQVLVYPYQIIEKNRFKYALLKRSDMGYWQAIAGGGEDIETPLETAKREAFEEATIPINSFYIQLNSIESIPVTEFRESYLWGEEIYVIPQYCFGVMVKDGRIVLSNEHTEYKWLGYEEAYNLLKYEGNRTSLWELNTRLRGKGPRG